VGQPAWGARLRVDPAACLACPPAVRTRLHTVKGLSVTLCAWLATPKPWVCGVTVTVGPEAVPVEWVWLNAAPPSAVPAGMAALV
jgi:hypothetical protein